MFFSQGMYFGPPVPIFLLLLFQYTRLSVEGKVQPVANKNLGDPRSVLLHLLHPTVHPLKAPLVCDVVHQQYTLRPPAVAPNDRTKPT